MNELERKEQMADNLKVTTWQNDEEAKIIAVECKFTVENVGGNALGGLAEGGSRQQ